MDALPHLPEDVLVEILVRLPARYIAGCRAVCRAWRSAIPHPNFDRAHAQRPTAHHEIEYYGVEGNRLLYRRLTRVVVFDFLHVGRERTPFPRALWFTLSMYTTVRGSWDGVLCLERGNWHSIRFLVDHYVLWNPLTMACATVCTPAPGDRIIGGYAHPETRRFHLLHALGETDHCHCHISPTIFRILRVGDAVWRELPMEDSAADPVTPMIFMRSTCRTPRVVRLHNNLHWLVSGTTVRLLVFDTTQEKFWSMKTPESHGQPLSLKTTRMSVLPCGKLCIFAAEPSSSTMETWVLDYSGGPHGSWRLKDRISLITWDGSDLSQEFRMANGEVVSVEDPREGEEVLLKRFSGRVDAYNFRRKVWRTVDVFRTTSVACEHQVMHGESLLQGQVSFANANRPLCKYVDWYGRRLYCL
ncbi:unnamed protein product [Alopecurus aequalis]